MCVIIRTLRAKGAVFSGKNKKTIPAIYQAAKVGLYFNKHPKNLKHSAPQKKTCLPGEGKDREKDPRTRIVGYCFVGCMWISACDGRWWPYSIL
jgi:hypothetical protein